MPYKLSSLEDLRNEKIDQVITRKSPGVYALDKTLKGQFTASYVGRSDNDLKAKLKTHVGSEYRYFKFDYADYSKNAYEKECELYHDFGGPDGKLDNKSHPDKPEGSYWKCPKCGE